MTCIAQTATMQTGTISFCDSVGINIKSDATKKTIVDKLETSYGVRIVKRHFDKYDEANIKRLNKHPYLACLKTNGNPYYLFLTKINFTNMCLFIDKKITPNYYLPRIIINRLGFADDLFEDTLFEGEMVQDQNKNWVFLINDMLVHRTKVCASLSLVDRLKTIYQILETEFRENPDDYFRIQVKKFVRYADIPWLIEEFHQKLPYTCRGVYFYPWKGYHRVILANFNDELIKKVVRVKYNTQGFITNIQTLGQPASQSAPQTPQIAGTESPNTKPKKATTKPMYLEQTDTEDYYLVYDPDTMQEAGIACVPTMKISKYLREKFQHAGLRQKLLLPCQLTNHYEKPKWQPIIQ